MNNAIDSYLTIKEKFQSFHNSLVISVGLFLIIMIFVIIVENLFYKIENQLFTSSSANYLAAKIIIWFVELITINLIFFSLGELLFSKIVNSYYIFYQIAFVLNLIFTLVKFSLKLYYSFKVES